MYQHLKKIDIKQKTKIYILVSIIITILIWYIQLYIYDGWYFVDPKLENIIIFKYLGKITAFATTILICWSFLLNYRLPIIRKLFKNPVEVRELNIFTTKWAFILMFFDPIFLAVNRLPDLSLYIRFFAFRSNSSFYGIGHNLGIVILLIILFTTIFLRQNYFNSTAKVIFRSFFGIIPFLVLLHILFVQGDVSRYPSLRVWVNGWIILAIFCHILATFFYRIDKEN